MELSRRCLLQCLVALGVAVVCVQVTQADDTMHCCMKGIKQMKSVVLCQAPCCHGYHEEVADPPNLSPLVWCKKDQAGEPKVDLFEMFGRRRRYVN